MEIGSIIENLFQSTPPREGGDVVGFVVLLSVLVFQSTPPARGATLTPSLVCGRMLISIHAPREGGDRNSV